MSPPEPETDLQSKPSGQFTSHSRVQMKPLGPSMHQPLLHWMLPLQGQPKPPCSGGPVSGLVPSSPGGVVSAVPGSDGAGTSTGGSVTVSVPLSSPPLSIAVAVSVPLPDVVSSGQPARPRLSTRASEPSEPNERVAPRAPRGAVRGMRFSREPSLHQ